MAKRPYLLPGFLGALVLLVCTLPAPAAVQVTFVNAGGITISGSHPTYTTGFGNVNGLGVGTAAAGLTVIQGTGGVLYATPYGFDLNLNGGQTASFTAYVSANFASSPRVAVYSCPVGGACTTAGGYSALSVNSAAPTSIASSAGPGTSTAYLALWVPENNGAGAFQSTQTATVSFTASRQQGVNQTDTVTMTISATGQSAVSLQIQSAPGGLTVNPSSDFDVNFGAVNGIGAGIPQAGLSTVSVAGGTVYVTPYELHPSFSNLTVASGTLSVQLGMNFGHPAELKLQDAASGAGPFTDIPSGSSLSLAAGVSNRQTVTRYLGLQVSPINGASAYAGADSATLTYTLTVL